MIPTSYNLYKQKTKRISICVSNFFFLLVRKTKFEISDAGSRHPVERNNGYTKKPNLPGKLWPLESVQKTFCQLCVSSKDNLKQIWSYSTHPTQEKLTKQNWNLHGFKIICLNPCWISVLILKS